MQLKHVGNARMPWDIGRAYGNFPDVITHDDVGPNGSFAACFPRPCYTLTRGLGISPDRFYTRRKFTFGAALFLASQLIAFNLHSLRVSFCYNGCYRRCLLRTDCCPTQSRGSTQVFGRHTRWIPSEMNKLLVRMLLYVGRLTSALFGVTVVSLTRKVARVNTVVRAR